MNMMHSSSRANIGTNESLVTDKVGELSFCRNNTKGSIITVLYSQSLYHSWSSIKDIKWLVIKNFEM